MSQPAPPPTVPLAVPQSRSAQQVELAPGPDDANRRLQREAAVLGRSPEAPLPLASDRSPLAVHALRVLWPAFLMAGVAEMLVFVVVDPADLHGFGGDSLGLGRQAVYTVTFMIFWVVISIASAITVLLGRDPQPY